MKKALIFLFLVLCVSFALSDTITDYTVPSSVPLGNNVTATGLFTATDGNKSGYLCSFYFLDANSGELIKRATDQYTTSTGRVTMAGFTITEPLFKRGSTYTLKTECGAIGVDANFLVAQRESIAHVGAQEFAFLTEPENTDTGFIWGSIIVVIVLICFVGIYFYRVARK